MVVLWVARGLTGILLSAVGSAYDSYLQSGFPDELWHELQRLVPDIDSLSKDLLKALGWLVFPSFAVRCIWITEMSLMWIQMWIVDCIFNMHAAGLKRPCSNVCWIGYLVSYRCVVHLSNSTACLYTTSSISFLKDTHYMWSVESWGTHKVLFIYLFIYFWISVAVTPREGWGNAGSRRERVTWGRGELSQWPLNPYTQLPRACQCGCLPFGLENSISNLLII